MASIIKVDDVQDAAGNNIINEAGDVITIGASGDTITVPSGATLSNLGTASGFLSPSFLSFRSSAASAISDNTWTLITFNSEKFDGDSTYNTSNGRFTPAVSGKYRIYAQVGGYGQSGGIANTTAIRIMKNGTDEVETRRSFDSSVIAEGGATAITIDAILDSNTTDYFEIYWYLNTDGGVNITLDYNASKLYTFFGGYRIGA